MKNNLISILSIVLLGLFLTEILLGSVEIDFLSEDSLSDIDRKILLSRLNRAFLGLLVGGAAGICGLVIQTLFKNPLAGPTTLGINSGAGLGAAIFYMMPFVGGLQFLGSAVFSVIGALLFLVILLLVSGKKINFSFLLIVGLLLSYVAYAFVEVLVQVSDDSGLRAYAFWGMGSLNNASLLEILILSILTVSGVVFMAIKKDYLNVYLLGEEELSLIFKNKERHTKKFILILIGVWIGCITSIVGPIAFVGIVVPNVLKLILKTNNHQKLIPLVFILGASLLLLADLLSRGVFLPFSLPLNAVLSIFGVPFILLILFKKIKNGRTY